MAELDYCEKLFLLLSFHLELYLKRVYLSIFDTFYKNIYLYLYFDNKIIDNNDKKSIIFS